MPDFWSLVARKAEAIMGKKKKNWGQASDWIRDRNGGVWFGVYWVWSVGSKSKCVQKVISSLWLVLEKQRCGFSIVSGKGWVRLGVTITCRTLPEACGPHLSGQCVLPVCFSSYLVQDTTCPGLHSKCPSNSCQSLLPFDSQLLLYTVWTHCPSFFQTPI